jgi:hypothetical protein
MSRNVGEPLLYAAYFVLFTGPFNVATRPTNAPARFHDTAPAQLSCPARALRAVDAQLAPAIPATAAATAPVRTSFLSTRPLPSVV